MTHSFPHTKTHTHIYTRAQMHAKVYITYKQTIKNLSPLPEILNICVGSQVHTRTDMVDRRTHTHAFTHKHTHSQTRTHTRTHADTPIIIVAEVHLL